MKNKLAEGAVGAKIVDYFAKNVEGDKVPVDANVLAGSYLGRDQIQYRITFDDESVSDWLITFVDGNSLDIESAECFNEVI